jgi:RNA polymerase primary sigma factor
MLRRTRKSGGFRSRRMCRDQALPSRLQQVCVGARAIREPKPAEIAHDVSLPLGEVEQILRSAQTPVSLEKPVGDEGESEFGHFLADRAPLPEDVADDNSRSRALTESLASLSLRERRVLELRCGLDGREPATLDEIGVIFSVTREPIRQIEKNSMGKLSALAEMKSLQDVA